MAAKTNAAPLAGGTRVVNRTSSSNDIKLFASAGPFLPGGARRRPRRDRDCPTGQDTLRLLTSLQHPEAVDRLKEIGAGLEVLPCDRSRFIANAIISQRSLTEQECLEFTREDDFTYSWDDALLWFNTPDVDWALATVNEYCKKWAERWLPRHLRWGAECLEAGTWPATLFSRILSMLRWLGWDQEMEGRGA